MPGGAQQLGDLLDLGLLGHGVGLGVLGWGQEPGADLADDLAGGPGPVLIGEPEHLLDEAGALPPPGQVRQQRRLPRPGHALHEQLVGVPAGEDSRARWPGYPGPGPRTRTRWPAHQPRRRPARRTRPARGRSSAAARRLQRLLGEHDRQHPVLQVQLLPEIGPPGLVLVQTGGGPRAPRRSGQRRRRSSRTAPASPARPRTR